MDHQPELTILMPCLNEAETLETCIRKAQTFLTENHVDGEILIADNGSTDGSREIAERCGARVEPVPERGYGAALIGGCNAARGKYVIMGDADDSYDFLHLMPFMEKLREGYDLVMGNRFKGGIEPGAMPPLHRYLGNPVLSFLARLFFPSKIHDYHCGLRGYNTESIRKLGLMTTGMEYASEMVVKATLNHLKIAEVPTTLKKDGRSKPPHLRSWSDGWRHLKFLLMHSPNWLFLYPGMLFFLLGLIMVIVLLFGEVGVFGIHTMMYGAVAVILGFNLIMFSMFTKCYARVSGFIPAEDKISRFLAKTTTEKGILAGLLLFLAGLILTIVAVVLWGKTGFGALEPERMMRLTIPAMLLLVIGLEVVFASFFIGILNIKHR